MTQIVLFGTGKGGAGKTTSAANLSAEAARRGLRTLLVDLDSQGDCATVLGARGGDPDAVEMMLKAKPWSPAQDVRPGLDLIPGDDATENLVDFLSRLETRHGTEGLTAVAQTFREAVQDYDLVVLDTPPARQSRVLLDSAMMAADRLVMPTKADTKSLKAIRVLVERYAFLRERGLVDDLKISGVLLFAVGSSSKTIRQETKDFLASVMGEVVPVFDAVVTYSEKADRDQGIQAQTAREYAEEAEALRARYEAQKADPVLRGSERVSYLDVKSYASGASRLVDDYERFADELLTQVGLAGERVAT